MCECRCVCLSVGVSPWIEFSSYCAGVLGCVRGCLRPSVSLRSVSLFRSVRVSYLSLSTVLEVSVVSFLCCLFSRFSSANVYVLDLFHLFGHSGLPQILISLLLPFHCGCISRHGYIRDVSAGTVLFIEGVSTGTVPTGTYLSVHNYISGGSVGMLLLE